MARTLCPLNIEVETLTFNVTGVEGDTKMEITRKYRPCSRRIIVVIRKDTRELTLLIPRAPEGKARHQPSEGRKRLPRNWTGCLLILDFPAVLTVENKFL